jgi:hypothetical protein
MSTSIQPHHQDSATSSTSSSSGSKGQGAILTALGAVGLVAGAGLAAAPSLSWSAGQALANLGNHWMLGAAVGIGSLGVLALGLVRKSLAQQAQNQPADPSLLLEQIATDLVSLREELSTLSNSGREQVQSIQTLQAEIGELRQSQSANAVSNEALFQLAASLDKLGHRIDQRLKLHHSTLQDTIDELAATVDHSRRAIEERLGQASLQSGPVEDGWDLEVSNQSDWTPPQELEHGSATNAATTGPAWRAPSVNTEAELEAVPNVIDGDAPGSLGLLDMFEDSVPAALPRANEPQANPLDLGYGAPHSEEGELNDKLGQLQSLLADPRLAQALRKLQQPR